MTHDIRGPHADPEAPPAMSVDDDEVWRDIKTMDDSSYAAKYGMCGGCGDDVAKCCGGCKEPLCRICPMRIAEGWWDQ